LRPTRPIRSWESDGSSAASVGGAPAPRGQLTRLAASGNGLGTNDDGRITQMEDWVAGEEVNYQYDSLGRLTLAQTTGPQWGQSFSYDGFGNLTAEVATKGTAPTVYNNYDPATNRLLGSGYTYDANGNLTAMPGLSMTYNVENRLTQAISNLNGTDNYGYDPAGHRVWKQGPDGVTHVYYNGLDGKPLADFSFNPQTQQVQGGSPMLYFAGKRVDNAAVEDRLGTAVVENGQQRMAFCPYGSERSGTASQVQYATYDNQLPMQYCGSVETEAAGKPRCLTKQEEVLEAQPHLRSRRPSA